MRKFIRYELFWILLCIIIFRFSSQTGTESSGLSGKLADLLYPLFGLSYEMLSLLIRKAAHFSEYALLGILTFRVASYRLKYGQVVCSLIFCWLYALSDEWHQSFVPGRAASLRDVLIDGLGACAGILLIRTVYRLFRKNNPSGRSDS